MSTWWGFSYGLSELKMTSNPINQLIDQSISQSINQSIIKVLFGCVILTLYVQEWDILRQTIPLSCLIMPLILVESSYHQTISSSSQVDAFHELRFNNVFSLLRIVIECKFISAFHENSSCMTSVHIEVNTRDMWFIQLETEYPLTARFMWPTWGPSGVDRTQMVPMLAPWNLLSGSVFMKNNFCLADVFVSCVGFKNTVSALKWY